MVGEGVHALDGVCEFDGGLFDSIECFPDDVAEELAVFLPFF